jgi:hypothetical protein
LNIAFPRDGRRYETREQSLLHAETFVPFLWRSHAEPIVFLFARKDQREPAGGVSPFAFKAPSNLNKSIAQRV